MPFPFEVKMDKGKSCSCVGFCYKFVGEKLLFLYSTYIRPPLLANWEEVHLPFSKGNGQKVHIPQKSLIYTMEVKFGICPEKGFFVGFKEKEKGHTQIFFVVTKFSKAKKFTKSEHKFKWGSFSEALNGISRGHREFFKKAVSALSNHNENVYHALRTDESFQILCPGVVHKKPKINVYT